MGTLVALSSGTPSKIMMGGPSSSVAAGVASAVGPPSSIPAFQSAAADWNALPAELWARIMGAAVSSRYGRRKGGGGGTALRFDVTSFGGE